MTKSERTPRLWTADGFVEDEWMHAESAGVLEDGNANVILPLEAFLALDSEKRERAGGRIGVSVQPGEGIEALEPWLDSLPLVALAFPAFSDGRSYSKAELLRTRYGFTGEIRAFGDVLIDQIAHMLRCGFSTLQVSNPVALARLEAGRRSGVPLYYQPTAREAVPAGRYSWRRQPQG